MTLKGYAAGIQNAVRMLMSLVGDMLDVGKADTTSIRLNQKDYILAPVLSDSIELLRTGAARKGLRLKTEIDENLPSRLWGDDVRLRQIITNLLTNAVKYTQRGSVTFCADYEVKHGVFILHISVRDTGMGIRPEDLDSIFDSYSRADEKENRHIQGTGLGLSITKKLVEIMHGTISVQSTYGQGSVFDVRIPQRIMDHTPIGDPCRYTDIQALLPPSLHRHIKAPKARILVVDDNFMNLEVFSGLLKKTEITIDRATGGEEAVKLCDSFRYDLIFIDHMMPHPDGIETLHIIRERSQSLNSSVPVVVLTANAVTGAREKYMSEGFSSYLTKPVTTAELENELMTFLPGDKVIFTD
jgi:CheY-like chemotaxis protein